MLTTQQPNSRDMSETKAVHLGVVWQQPNVHSSAYNYDITQVNMGGKYGFSTQNYTVNKTNNNKISISEKDDITYIKGSGQVVVEGDVILKVKRAMHMEVSGDVNLRVLGDLNHQVDGDYNIKCLGHVNIDGEMVYINSDRAVGVSVIPDIIPTIGN